MDMPGAREKLSKTLKAMGHCPPPNLKGTKQYKKWKKTITVTHRRNKERLAAHWKSKLIPTLRKHQHKRKESAEALGITVSHMVRLMTTICKEDPDFKQEFMAPELSLRLKLESCWKTRKENRLKFIKENKHLILQAYYQNNELDYEASKIFKVDTRTFKRWREDIEQYEM